MMLYDAVHRPSMMAVNMDRSNRPTELKNKSTEAMHTPRTNVRAVAHIRFARWLSVSDLPIARNNTTLDNTTVQLSNAHVCSSTDSIFPCNKK